MAVVSGQATIIRLMAHVTGDDYEASLANLLIYSAMGGVVMAVGLIGCWLMNMRSRLMCQADLHAVVRVELERLLKEAGVVDDQPPDWEELGRS